MEVGNIAEQERRRARINTALEMQWMEMNYKALEVWLLILWGTLKNQWRKNNWRSEEGRGREVISVNQIELSCPTLLRKCSLFYSLNRWIVRLTSVWWFFVIHINHTSESWPFESTRVILKNNHWERSVSQGLHSETNLSSQSVPMVALAFPL